MKSKFLSPYIATPSRFHIICTCCHSAVAQGNSCDRDHMSAKLQILTFWPFTGRVCCLLASVVRGEPGWMSEIVLFLLSLLWKKAEVFWVLQRGHLFARPFPSNSNLLPRPRSAEVWHPHAQDVIPAHVFEIEALLRDYAVFTRLQKLPEVPRWSLEDRWGERHCSSSWT